MTAPNSVPLMTVNEVAKRLNCSARTVYRLCDAGRMPLPLRIGTLVRWHEPVIEAWIAEGCPAVAKVPGGAS
jgi:excisionase family DNA binding protein